MNQPTTFANWPYPGTGTVQSAAFGSRPDPSPKPQAGESGRAAAPAPVAPVASERSQVVKESAPTLAPECALPVKRAPKPAKAVARAAAKPQQAAPPPAAAVAPVLKAGSEVRLPSVSKRATQAAMQAQMSQAVEPSHDPAAAKATFSPSPERVMVPVSVALPKKDPALANNWKTLPLERLSDADVLSMPDAEYMNELQLAYFRRKLQQLKHDIHVSAGETTEHLREDTAVVPDPADRATIEEEHALELRTRDRERKLLKKIEQSIARIDAGDYGYCDETGEPIGVGRLLARPTASLSIEAQQRRELKQKLFGD